MNGRCKPTPDFPVCTKAEKEEASRRCAMLLDRKGPFGECVNGDYRMAKLFSRNCRFDVCLHIYADEALKNDLVCRTMEEFEETCETEGYDLYEWRKSAKCRKLIKFFKLLLQFRPSFQIILSTMSECMRLDIIDFIVYFRQRATFTLFWLCF